MTLILSGTNGLSDVDGSAATPAIRGTDTNTGLFFPAADTVGIATGGTERARVDSSGNLGLGVTPSAWSGFTALQIQNGALFTDSTSFRSIMNGYYNGSNWIYSTTNAATRYEQVNGIHRWFNAASGTAGNAISFTQAMTLDASGNLLVGATSQNGTSSRLYIKQSGDDAFKGVNIVSAASQEWLGSISVLSSGILNIAQTYLGGSGSYQPITFTTGGSERARIDSSGNLLVGMTSGGSKLNVNGTAWINGGVYPNSTGADNSRIFNSTSGTTGTVTTYIGNAAITTSSDVRLKENIVDSQRNALELLAQLRVVDHTWNDPSDTSVNNRNSRGVWTGLIAQEAQPVIPWLVNKPLTDEDEEGNPQYWHMDYGYAVPLLIKAIQELKAEFDAYKATHP